ncbi:MAG: hypothetical protein NT045_09195 [Candidatus Aureabacteria bacterium]|nr:hypothetical protein [Candidatus Auribacterota bacterium]
MAKRNRKLNEGFSMASLTGRWILIALVAVSCSLLYVWQHVQLVRTGYAIKKMECEMEQWKKENEELQLVNERLKSPQRIERVLAENRLGLVFPKGSDVVRLRYPRHGGIDTKEESGSDGGTDTLLSYVRGGGAAGRKRI